MQLRLIILTVFAGLASSPVWGQSYNDHTTDYQLDAEQAEQINQNEQMRERQQATQLQMQSMQQQIADLQFQKAVEDMDNATKASTYFH